MLRKIIDISLTLSQDVYSVIVFLFSIVISLLAIFVGKYDDQFPMFLFFLIFFCTACLLQLFTIIISNLSKRLYDLKMEASGFFIKKSNLNHFEVNHMTIDYQNTQDDEGFREIKLCLNTPRKVSEPIQAKLISVKDYFVKCDGELISCVDFGNKKEYILPKKFNDTMVENIYNLDFRIKPSRSNGDETMYFYFEVWIENDSHHYHYAI